MAVICAFILNAGLNFVLGLLIAKLLGPAEFGLFALATAGAIVANTVLFEWLRLSATRFYSTRVRAQEPWIRQGLDGAYAVLGAVLLAAALVCAGFGVEAGPESRAAIAAGAAIAALGIGVFDYHAALARAREGSGPTFIEAFTYRMGAHTTSDDPTRYRLAGELEEWKLRDPIARLKAHLSRSGKAGPEFFATVDAEGDELAVRIRKGTLEMPDPAGTEMFDHVYAEQTEEIAAQRAEFLSYHEGFEQ